MFRTTVKLKNINVSLLTKEQIEYLKSRRDERIAELKRDGKTWSEIAKEIGLSREYTKMIGHKLGVRGPVKFFEEQKKKEFLAKNQFKLFG